MALALPGYLCAAQHGASIGARDPKVVSGRIVEELSALHWHRLATTGEHYAAGMPESRKFRRLAGQEVSSGRVAARRLSHAEFLSQK